MGKTGLRIGVVFIAPAAFLASILVPAGGIPGALGHGRLEALTFRPKSPTPFVAQRATGPADKAEPKGWNIAADQARALTICFGTAGSWLAVPGTDGIVRVVDTDSGKILLSHDQHMSSTHAFSDSVALSSDGKLIASALGEKGVELWDALSGKTMGRFEVPERKQEMVSPAGKHYTFDLAVGPTVGAFSPDGALLAVVSAHKVLFFDVATGKPRLSLPWVGGDGAVPAAGPSAVFVLGGEVAATACFSSTIVLWDLKTGKQVRQLERQEGTVAAISTSPDGRLIASCTGYWWESRNSMSGIDQGDHAVQLWNAASGRRLLNIKGHTDNVRSVAYFPDGRLLLSGGEDNTIRLWEIATGKQLARWDMAETVKQVAISPDGRKVATVLDDRSVTLFPLDAPQPEKIGSPVDVKGFEGLWADLAGEDAEQAYRAVRTLSKASEEVPSMMRERLRPARGLAQLIADLDSNDFDRREAASKELAAAGADALPAVRKALEETTSEEVRTRITQLLKPLGEWAVTDPDTLRSLRAIWVLERIGTPEARAVLEDLAKGAPEVRQTQEARAALDFLDKRAAAKP